MAGLFGLRRRRPLVNQAAEGERFAHQALYGQRRKVKRVLEREPSTRGATVGLRTETALDGGVPPPK